MKSTTLLLALLLACGSSFGQNPEYWIWYSSPLLTEPPEELKVDAQGNAWMAEGSKLLSFDGAGWENIDVAASGLGLANPWITAFEFTETGEIWITCYDRMLKYDPVSGTWEAHDPTGPNWSAQGTGIGIDQANHVWWLCYSGLYEYDGSQWTEHDLPSGSPPDFPYYGYYYLFEDILIDQEGNKWVVTTDLLLTELIVDVGVFPNTLIKYSETETTVFTPVAADAPFGTFHLIRDAEGNPVMIPLGYSLSFDNEYQTYENGAWSDPVEIPFSGYINDAVITGDNKMYVAFYGFIAVGDLNTNTWEVIDIDESIAGGIRQIAAKEDQGIFITGYWENILGFYPFYDYKIFGRVYADLNENGNFDAGDLKFKNQLVQTTDGQNLSFTNSEGEYALAFPDTGVYTLEVLLPPHFSCGLPASGQQTVALTPPDSVVTGIDFGLISDTSGADLAIEITPITPANPGFFVKYAVNYRNLSAELTDLQIDIHFDSLLTFQNASTAPASQNGNELSFLPGSIGGLEEKILWLRFTLPPDGSLIGEVLNLEGSISPLNNNELDPSNNTTAFFHKITGPLDPNYIAVTPEGFGPDGEIFHLTPSLDYTIHFQNVGNDTAHNVVIANPIDPDLDLLTLQVLGASHDYQISFDNEDRVINWEFNDIGLVDSLTNETESHGFIRYSLAPVSQEVGLTLTNHAGIYFDFNDPIATNTVVNTLVEPAFQTPLEAAICQGESYVFAGDTLSQSGVYVNTLHTAAGYDSLLVLSLTVHPLYETQVKAGICDGGDYDFNGQIVSETGIYYDTLSSIYGCDSIVVLDFTSDPAFFYRDTIEVNICEGNPFIFNGQAFSVCGIYVYEFLTSRGCDSTIVLILNCYPGYYTEETYEICEGQSLFVHGQTLSEAGVHSIYLQSQYGCDSVFVVSLVVYPEYLSTFEEAICEGEEYLWQGNFLTEPGSYSDTLSTYDGCDSVLVLDLTVLPFYEFFQKRWLCGQNYYVWHGETLTMPGTYVDTLASIAGCDSVLILTLHADTIFTTFIHDTFCPGTPYFWNGAVFDSAGTYTNFFTTFCGCDSIVTLQLTESTFETTFLTEHICTGELYEWNGQLFSECGIYVDTLETYKGCDSIIFLELICHPSRDTAVSRSVCDGAAYNFNGHLLTEPGGYFDTLSTVFGCDSIIQLNLFYNVPYTTITQAAICSGESFVFNGNLYSSGGVYVETIHPASGCDSNFILALTVFPGYYQDQTAYLCAGDTLEWQGNILTAAGIYYDSLQSINGCDSVVMINLDVQSPYQTQLEASICAGESFNFNGTLLTETGVYTDSLQTVNGCDSNLVLTLTVFPEYYQTQTASVCMGDSLEWQGEILTETGVFYDTLLSMTGCDSVLNLALTVHPEYEIQLDAEIQEGEVYEFGGQLLSEEGVYFDSLITTEGCDSVIVLTLTVIPPSGAKEPAWQHSCTFSASAAAGQVIIQFREEGQRTATLYDLQGRPARQVSGSQATLVIPAGDLSSGPYFVLVRGDDCPAVAGKLVLVMQ